MYAIQRPTHLNDSVDSFDPEPSQQLGPNCCRRIPLPTALVSSPSSYGVHLPLLPAVAHSMNVGLQTIEPSLTTKFIGSARNHRSNLDPVFA
jgi:hypothetical protein